MGWKWDYFQKVSVFENNKYDPRESNIYLAIWPFYDLQKNIIIVLKLIVLEGLCFGKLHVSTFFSGHGNVDFENGLIFDPSFNIRWEKTKTVC